MGNTRIHVREARKKLRDGFRRVFPKSTNLLKKKGKQANQSKVAKNNIPAPPLQVPQPGLTVTTTIRFEDPLQKVSSQVYKGSDRLDVSEELIQALLNRIEHCTNELINRTDVDAGKPLRHTDPRVKPARYHILYQICRDGHSVGSPYYTSWDIAAVTPEVAQSITSEVDSIVSMFLLHHDPEFQWHVPAIEDGHRSVLPVFGKPQDMHCVPTLDEPAFSIDVAVRTKIRGREALRNFTVNSSQSTPLTLQLGESMLTELSDVTNLVKTSLESEFADSHAGCPGLEGRYGCRHVEEGAFEMMFKVRNHFGPDYQHMASRVQSHRRLLHPGDADELMQAMHADVEGLVAKYDEICSETDDFTVTIHELRSHNWAVRDPLKVSIDGSACRNRVTTEKMLQRIQSGIFHVLRGHGTMAFVTVHKRGHLVLDTTVCRGENFPYWELVVFENLHLKKRVLQRRLRDRIIKDLTAVCKDTIRLAALGPIDFKVTMPEDPDVIALSQDANEKIERMRSAASASGADVGLGIYLADDADDADQHNGNVLGKEFSFMASVVSRNESEAEGHDTSMLEPESDDEVRFLPRIRPRECSQGARTPPAGPLHQPNEEAYTPDDTPPRSAYALVTPVQEKSRDDDDDGSSGARTPPSPSEGELMQFADLLTGVGHLGIPRSQATWALPQADDEDKIDDVVAIDQDAQSFSDSFVYVGTHLSPIKEENEDDDRNSVRTVVFTTLEGPYNATSLLASMADADADALAIPKFSVDHCSDDEDDNGASSVDEERTITQSLFDQNGHGSSHAKSVQKVSESRDSDDDLRRTLLADSVHDRMDLTHIAEPSSGAENDQDDEQKTSDAVQHDENTASNQDDGCHSRGPVVPFPSAQENDEIEFRQTSAETVESNNDNQGTRSTTSPNGRNTPDSSISSRISSSQAPQTDQASSETTQPPKMRIHRRLPMVRMEQRLRLRIPHHAKSAANQRLDD